MTIDGELVTRKLLLITRELDALREVHGRGVDTVDAYMDMLHASCFMLDARSPKPEARSLKPEA